MKPIGGRTWKYWPASGPVFLPSYLARPFKFITPVGPCCLSVFRNNFIFLSLSLKQVFIHVWNTVTVVFWCNRLKDGKKPGKSYQEERQRLNERRQTTKFAPSRAENEVEEGGAEAEGWKTDEGGRPEKFARPLAKAQDSKKTPERPKRPERKIASPKEAQKEERKRSYAQEREQRRNTVRKDAPTTPDEVRPSPNATGSVDKDKSAPHKEKSEQGTTTSKGKDPRAERRIRNKVTCAFFAFCFAKIWI